jgi:2'-5' RNA ligase
MVAGKSTMRVFIGIPLRADVRSELESVVAPIKPAIDNARWSPPEGWHITLQFLGTIAAATCTDLCAQLGQIRAPAFSLQLGQLDLFDRAGVFFADVLVSPSLAALHQSVLAATASCGFVAESRPYHPHITLARLKGESQTLRSRLPRSQHFPASPAGEFLLYESLLNPQGSRYEVRARFPLGPPRQAK